MGLSINKQKLINQECHTTIVTLSSSAIKEKKNLLWQQKRNREIIILKGYKIQVLTSQPFTESHN